MFSTVNCFKPEYGIIHAELYMLSNVKENCKITLEDILVNNF